MHTTQDLNPLTKVAALEQDVLRILVAIRSAMNQIIPINRLPPEILAKAFEFREGDKDLICATHVCQRWRYALISNPSLWTDVVFRSSNRRVLTYLPRSGALPINVSFMPTHASTWKSHLEDILTSPIPWVNRVKLLNVEGDEEQIETVIQRLCLPAPLLQSLKLDRGQDPTLIGRLTGPVHFPNDFLGGHAISLRTLSFNSISPRTPITILPLPSLTSFIWLDENSKVAAEDLLELLVSAPLLEYLAIRLRVRSPSVAEQRTVVTLNRLQRLTWSNIEGIFTLTSCLIAPELRCLGVRLISAPESLQCGLASILPPNEGHLPLLIEPTEMNYTAREGSRLCYFHSATGTVSIAVIAPFGYRDNRTLPWPLRNTPISFRQVKEMTLEVGYHSFEGIPIEQFENLETLELVGDGTILQPYYDRFSGARVIPFPALLRLLVTLDHPSFDILASALVAREQAGHRVGTLRVRGVCRRSTDIPIAKMKESVGELVLELMHGANCSWHLAQS